MKFLSKYFVPVAQYMAAQTQIMQLTAKRDTLEADYSQSLSNNKTLRARIDSIQEDLIVSEDKIKELQKQLMCSKICVKEWRLIALTSIATIFAMLIGFALGGM